MTDTTTKPFEPGDRVICTSLADGATEYGTVIDRGPSILDDLGDAARVGVHMDNADRYASWSYVTWPVSQVEHVHSREEGQ